MKGAAKMAAGGVMLLGLLLAGGQTAEGQSATAVPQLDQKQFMAAWFDVAQFPGKLQKNCVKDAKILYAPGEKKNTFDMVKSCLLKKGNAEAWNSHGSLGERGDGRLSLSFLWFLSKAYWVVAVGPSYEWMLVGSPGHGSLWVLSKTPALAPGVLEEIKARAAAEGYNVSKLVMMPQTQK